MELTVDKSLFSGRNTSCFIRFHSSALRKKQHLLNQICHVAKSSLLGIFDGGVRGKRGPLSTNVELQAKTRGH